MSVADEAPLLNDIAVAEYLRAHPDFFERMPGLISELRLPHDTGRAVSLVERQVSILRDRNIDMRKRLSELVGTAHANEALFEKTRTLTLALLEAQQLSDINGVLAEELKTGFEADFAVCFYSHSRVLPRFGHLIYADSPQDLPLFHLTQGTGISCGLLRPDEFETLFGEQPASEGSAAMAQLNYGTTVGMLAVGSRDPKRFSPDMGSLFVRYIADVLARRLASICEPSSQSESPGHDD